MYLYEAATPYKSHTQHSYPIQGTHELFTMMSAIVDVRFHFLCGGHRDDGVKQHFWKKWKLLHHSVRSTTIRPRFLSSTATEYADLLFVCCDNYTNLVNEINRRILL